jgi:uncharacterized OB-fold protein
VEGERADTKSAKKAVRAPATLLAKRKNSGRLPMPKRALCKRCPLLTKKTLLQENRERGIVFVDLVTDLPT